MTDTVPLLRARLDEALEEIRQLRAALRPPRLEPAYRGLSRSESIVAHALLTTDGLCPTSYLADRLDLLSARGVAHTRDHISILILRLRRKLGPSGIVIETLRSAGYAMTPASKALMERWSANSSIRVTKPE